jgi:hypothetical protein
VSLNVDTHLCIEDECPVCNPPVDAPDRVQEIEYYRDGALKRVRYHKPDAPWHGGETK